MPSASSPLVGVLETVLYYDAGQEDALEHFYRDVLGLEFMGRGRWSLGFRIAPGAVLLLFEAAKSSVQDEPPPHGATGKIHTCFLVRGAEDYETWKEHVAARAEIIDEITWDESGLRSFYFDDPAGNVLEIAEGDLWM